MKHSMIVAVVVSLALAASAVASEYGVSSLASNLYVTAGAGVARCGGQTALFEGAGLAVGIPVAKLNNGVVIGAQLGGDLTLNQVDSRAIIGGDATAGLFARNIAVWQGHQIAGAALFDYSYTPGYNNLVSFRPVVGTTLTAKDEAFLTASVALVKDDGVGINNTIGAGWTRNWTDSIATQARVGYAFNPTDEPMGGASVEYRLTKNISVVLAGDVNGNRDYVASINFVIGGKGQSGSALSQIGGSGLKPFNR